MSKYVFVNSGIRHGFYKVLGVDSYDRIIIQALAVFWHSGVPWRKVAKGSPIKHDYIVTSTDPLNVINAKIQELEDALKVLKEVKNEMETSS